MSVPDSVGVMTRRWTPRTAPDDFFTGEGWIQAQASFRAFDHVFGVRCNDPEMAAHVGNVLCDLRADAPLGTVYSIVDRGPSRDVRRRYAFYSGHARVGFAASAVRALALLQWQVNHDAIAALDPACIALHAGAVEIHGALVLLPGISKAGKTTTVAWLVRSGARYLSDEAVALDLSSGSVRAYPKPMSIDPGSWAVLMDLNPPADPRTGEWQLPVSSLRPDAIGSGGAPQLIVAPQYVRGAATELQPMTKAQTLLVLLSSALGLPGRPAEGLRFFSELAVRCPGYRLVVDDLDVVPELLRTAIDEACAPAELTRRQP